MRNIIILILAFSFSSLSANAQTKPLEITHLTGDFYVYTTYNLYKGSPVPANALYLVTNEGVVMIDCPWDSTQFQPLLDSIQLKHNKKVVMYIATHSHADRTIGLEFYRKHGVKTYSTVQTDEICKKKHEKRAEFLMIKDTTFKIGQYSFQTFYPGPGHTVDNIVVWFPKDKVLYGGCFIKSTDASDLGNVTEADISKWPASIKKLQAKFPDPVYVIPGHDDWKNKASLEHTLDLLKTNSK
jgi:glyoxylase-like metal-dependent hydrolase (beta-lactamase superfamily II)